jgi:hypothetical protein
MTTLISDVELTVFGGPDVVDLSLDFGEQGKRGSKIWSGNGSPETQLVGQELELNDIYLNTNPSDTYYGWTYQYVLDGVNPVWQRILNPIKPDFSTIATTTFTAGSTTINVPVSSLTTNSSPSISRFIVRYSIVNSNPVASGFTYSLTGSYPNQNIAIVINAVSYSGGTWSNLTGSQNVHLYVTYK